MTIEGVWDFLMNTVYNGGKGEFRIHSNKKGVRLYLDFADRRYTGWKYIPATYVFTVPPSKMNTQIYNIQNLAEEAVLYRKSIVGETLIDTFEKHQALFDSGQKQPPPRREVTISMDKEQYLNLLDKYPKKHRSMYSWQIPFEEIEKYVVEPQQNLK